MLASLDIIRFPIMSSEGLTEKIFYFLIITAISGFILSKHSANPLVENKVFKNQYFRNSDNSAKLVFYFT